MKEDQKIFANTLSLIAKISYIAVGILGLASLFVAGVPVAMTMAFLTVGTVFTLGKFFYDRVLDPFDEIAKKLTKHPFYSKAVQLEPKFVAEEAKKTAKAA